MGNRLHLQPGFPSGIDQTGGREYEVEDKNLGPLPVGRSHVPLEDRVEECELDGKQENNQGAPEQHPGGIQHSHDAEWEEGIPDEHLRHGQHLA